jgi:hypothetical protein
VEKALQEAESLRGKSYFDDERVPGGVELKELPSGLSKAPVQMIWLDKGGLVENLMFVSGQAAMHQHPDDALEVRTGWAIVGGEIQK